MTWLHHVQCLKYFCRSILSALVCKWADVTFKWNFHLMFILKAEQGRKRESFTGWQGDSLNPFLFQKATHSHCTFMEHSYTDLILTSLLFWAQRSIRNGTALSTRLSWNADHESLRPCIGTQLLINYLDGGYIDPETYSHCHIHSDTSFLFTTKVYHFLEWQLWELS